MIHRRDDILFLSDRLVVHNLTGAWIEKRHFNGNITVKAWGMELCDVEYRPIGSGCFYRDGGYNEEVVLCFSE